jgi:hypothetical protein
MRGDDVQQEAMLAPPTPKPQAQEGRADQQHAGGYRGGNELAAAAGEDLGLAVQIDLC